MRYFRYLLTTLVMLSIFVLSGAVFLAFVVEHLMDYFRKKAPESEYLQGITFHLISYVVTTIMFYFVIHIHYQYIHIDFWVILVIIGFLFLCKEIFYPDSENLNRKK